MITALVWLILLGFIAWLLWNYFRVRQAAQFVDNDTFKTLMPKGQLIDLRDGESFRRKHILGARNFQAAQFKDSLSALRKDKPVLLYENARGANTARSILTLKKAGFTDIYVLKDGFDYWDGKVKEAKIKS
ncbi:rhodanese-like domain-containing protein [Streptococcus sp. sy010]|uniref:rhodanese-like domain-containing protein n=1 Tax=Streptococcus sp. sy010 TaxID=2600148 RepID=UPI0011B6D48E|nr:rhodanese-like domain-containing protein [Streptococcus sp. sy010]TWT16551.1 rhodanese-like domain-containing protein [Streptococcus sp. sy010]